MTDKPITLTENAAKHIKSEFEISRSQGKDILGLKIAIKTTGCSGYAYILDFIYGQGDEIEQEKPHKSLVNHHIFRSHDINIYVDDDSYKLIAGTEVDYVKKDISSVMVFNNPNATAECGCGESFTIDEDKK